MVLLPLIQHTFTEHMRRGRTALGETGTKERKTATVRFPRRGRQARVREVR